MNKLIAFCSYENALDLLFYALKQMKRQPKGKVITEYIQIH